jgi:hypothetical protein
MVGSYPKNKMPPSTSVVLTMALKDLGTLQRPESRGGWRCTTKTDTMSDTLLLIDADLSETRAFQRAMPVTKNVLTDCLHHDQHCIVQAGRFEIFVSKPISPFDEAKK